MYTKLVKAVGMARGRIILQSERVTKQGRVKSLYDD